jgi:hypothetical protein
MAMVRNLRDTMPTRRLIHRPSSGGRELGTDQSKRIRAPRASHWMTVAAVLALTGCSSSNGGAPPSVDAPVPTTTWASAPLPSSTLPSAEPTAAPTAAPAVLVWHEIQAEFPEAPVLEAPDGPLADEVVRRGLDDLATAGGGLLAPVGFTLASSPDGTAWTAVPVPTQLLACAITSAADVLVVAFADGCDRRRHTAVEDPSGEDFVLGDGVDVAMMSRDGVHFSDVTLPPDAFGRSISDLAGYEGRVVIGGAANREREGDEFMVLRDMPLDLPEATLWMTDDGTDWARLTYREPFETLVDNIVAGRSAGLTLLANGPKGVLAALDTTPAICGSDGVCLEPARLVIARPGDDTIRDVQLADAPAAMVTAIAPTTDGFIVAVVAEVKPSRDGSVGRSELWHVLPDGTWTVVYRASDSGRIRAAADIYDGVLGLIDLGNEEITDIAMTPYGFVAVGRRQDLPLVLRSPDGVEWTDTLLRSEQPSLVGTRQQLEGVATIGDRVLVVGGSSWGIEDPSSEAIAWALEPAT